MALNDGQTATLQERARELDREAALSVLFSIASQLDVLHARGTVYRHVEPANIRFDQDGRPDLLEYHSLLTEAPVAVEARVPPRVNPGYRAPEISEQPDDASPQSDVFSLAMVATFALCDDPDQLPEDLQGEKQQAFKKLDLPPRAHRVLERASDAEPTNRHRTATDFCRDLERALQALPQDGRRKIQILKRTWQAALAKITTCSRGFYAWINDPKHPMRANVAAGLAVFLIVTVPALFWSGLAPEEGETLPLPPPSAAPDPDQAPAPKLLEPAEGSSTAPLVVGPCKSREWTDRFGVTWVLVCPDEAPASAAARPKSATAEVRSDKQPAAFWIAKHEVTHGQYRKFQPGHQNRWHGADQADDLPATNVSWHNAQAFCVYFGVRLPTAAEWDRAARTAGVGEDDGGLARVARFGLSRLDGPTAVGSHDANERGLHDLYGNVWEWVADPVPTEDTDRWTEYRLMKGGSFWQSREEILNVPYLRSWAATPLPDLGFRCIQTAKSASPMQQQQALIATESSR